MEIELAYHPITAINEVTYDSYLLESGIKGIPGKIVIEPFETALKASGLQEFDFSDFRVKRTDRSRKATSWQKVYSSFLEFLKIRADDSRAATMGDVRFFDGIGYCISAEALREFIAKIQEKNTSESSYPLLSWPGKKKHEDYPTDILIPDRDFSLITPENARLVLHAKRFSFGLEAEVDKAFKKLNQQWHAQETGYDMGNLPGKEQSPLKRVRKIANGKYVFVALIREEVPKYEEALATLKTELGDLENGIALPGFKVKQDGRKVFVNIKNLLERLDIERLKQDDLLKVEGRYEIAP